eukprot:11139_1
MGQTTTTENKSDDNYDEELNCINESIVHVNGDERRPITESIYNEEDIIKCIGQLEINYRYIKQEYKQTEWGTGTVFKTNGQKCYVLSAAHNTCKKIKECENCMKYMEIKIKQKQIQKCIYCNYNKLNNKMIKATKILFRRREIKHQTSIYNEKEKETIYYKFGDNRKCYECKCELMDENNYNLNAIPTSG